MAEKFSVVGVKKAGVEGRRPIVEHLRAMKRSFTCTVSHWEASRGLFRSWSDVLEFAFSFFCTGCSEDVN